MIIRLVWKLNVHGHLVVINIDKNNVIWKCFRSDKKFYIVLIKRWLYVLSVTTSILWKRNFFIDYISLFNFFVRYGSVFKKFLQFFFATFPLFLIQCCVIVFQLFYVMLWNYIYGRFYLN